MENQGKKQNKLLNKLLGLPDNVSVVFDTNNNTLLASKLIDDNGNQNIFRIIVDKNAPDITQRIYANDFRNSY